MLVGLTGLIGSGKTTAARILQSFGAKVIDADSIGREVVDSNPALLRQLVNAFGNTILNRDGSLNRQELANNAFKSDDTKETLNRLVHPYLLEELKSQLKLAGKTYDVIVIDAALLLYWQMDRDVDFVLVIHASKEQRYRFLEARGMNLDDAKAREKAQLPFREFQRRSDRVILNNQSVQALERKLAYIYRNVFTKK